MPSAAARQMYEDQIPSFMTVFGLDEDVMADRDTVTVMDPKMVGVATKSPELPQPPQQGDLRPVALPSNPAHIHRDSTSTQLSESADSSPTTTLSTTDSSPLSDPSPSSSPDSPVNLIPLNNYPSSTFGGHITGTAPITANESAPLIRPMTSPAPRRPRNMKGLSILPPSAAASAVSTVTEPSSPCFIKPKMPAMKRKPSQLSLKTSTLDLMNKSHLDAGASPAVPAMPPILQRRALRHSSSSPHMSALQSSTFGPSGGMCLPRMLERNESGLSEVLRPMKSSMKMTFDNVIVEEDSPIRTQVATRSEFEPYNESINNEDQKTPGYPDGPLAIYGDDVFLYLEPKAEEAVKFDVVINVAREVKNPFECNVEKPADRHWGDRQSQPTPPGESPVPDTAVSTASFMTAFEYQPVEDRALETPTTPKANPFKTPEYIHMLWDHNTDIAPDLMHLCETIENRTNEGKKVLVHCQQGASRSASLIIAYGLYQNPDLSVNDAYYAAQAKSQWISPNMKLMYSLQDFHKELGKKRTVPLSALRPRAGRSPTKHRLTLSADAIEVPPKEPRTAPLPGEDRPREGEPNKSPRLDGRPGGSLSPGSQDISPGPASAPITFSWRESLEPPAPETLFQPSSHPDAPSLFNHESLPRRPKSGLDKPSSSATQGSLLDSWSGLQSPAPVSNFNMGFNFQSTPMSFFQSMVPQEPLKEEHSKEQQLSSIDQAAERTVTVTSAYPEEDALMSPRAETMTKIPIHEFASGLTGMSYVESPPTPTEGLFSPREGMFPRDPFSMLGRPPQVADPRSPPMKGETPITRSIDDFL